VGACEVADHSGGKSEIIGLYLREALEDPEPRAIFLLDPHGDLMKKALPRVPSERLKSALQMLDSDESEDDFVLRLFEQFGIDEDDQGQRTTLIDPAHLSTDGFPGLQDGPQLVTFNRAVALAREDLPFLRADHPMVTGALDLLENVAGRVLDRAGLAAGDLGGLVTVSTTGIATPSLDALLIERMQLPRNIARLPIFGLGCAGGVVGLARAANMAAALPGKPVLCLVVELCTLSFRRGDLQKSNIVATALFGDGAAAALLRCDGESGGAGEGPAIIATGEHTWPKSLDIMGWDVADDGLKAIFSRDIPRLMQAELKPVVDDFLARQGLRLADIDRFVCHPGGPKVLDAFEEVFGLEAGALTEARGVLHDYGNMSAASVLFVLERMLGQAGATGAAWGQALMTALGPGFTAGFALLGGR